MLMMTFYIILFMFIIGNMIFVSSKKTFINCFFKGSNYCFKYFFFFVNNIKMFGKWVMFFNSIFSIFSLWGGISPFNFSFNNSNTWQWLFSKFKFI
uniref:NADH dehydrogenase subunit 4L n=1 Tax=Pidorus atratus TaxID=2015464 RepID=A0A343XA14_9NEOP|nr:NADH dehydrogenase subunit 4L [Pidorus atratus]AWI14403.1 NADH dehydrogenase subunit 4L [Pidorus atratus]